VPQDVSLGAAALGGALRGLRRAAKLSQEELAKRSAVSLTTIKEIEQATMLRERRKETLPDLSVALGQDPGYLDEALSLGIAADQRRAAEAAAKESAQPGIAEMLRKVDEKLEEILILQRDIVYRIGRQPEVELDLEGYHHAQVNPESPEQNPPANSTE
jgi:transcriptional regulator with XRE-family HTH domain